VKQLQLDSEAQNATTLSDLEKLKARKSPLSADRLSLILMWCASRKQRS